MTPFHPNYNEIIYISQGAKTTPMGVGPTKQVQVLLHRMLKKAQKYTLRHWLTYIALSIAQAPVREEAIHNISTSL